MMREFIMQTYLTSYPIILSQQSSYIIISSFFDSTLLFIFSLQFLNNTFENSTMQTHSYKTVIEPPYTNVQQNTYYHQQEPKFPSQKITIIQKSKPQLNVIPPQQMLQALLFSIADNQPEQTPDYQMIHRSEMEMGEQIKNLRLEINNLRSEVVQVQNLLNVRDTLYQELDHLRQERQEIETEIQSVKISKSQKSIAGSENIKQMNERLRRRIFEIREYIQKMSEENMKIETGIAAHLYQNQQEEIFHLRKQILQKPVNQKTSFADKKYNKTNFQRMVSNLHDKQQQAWRRVRRQQEDIDRRNNERRSNKGNNFTYYSPKARTYYSPGRQIY